jgi:hypothetical protein
MNAVVNPKMNEFFKACVVFQNISCPIEFVPKRCWKLGGLSLGTTFHDLGSYGEKVDKIAKKTKIDITVNPNRNFLSLFRRSFSITNI